MHVRYQKGDDSLAEADFVIPVAPREDTHWWYPFLGCAFVGVLLGILGAFAFMMWRRRRVPL
jgi:hypothetical protein